KVKVTDARGCSTECYVEVDCSLDNPGINVVDPNVVDNSSTIGQLNVINDYTLRPNPTSAQVYLDFESKLAEKVTINVTDNFGKLVYTKKVTTVKGFNTELLETNHLPVGLYQVSLISSDKLKTLQLIKVK
ncbi:MAG TPA: T9SS type A sorting domain-containing protein, partial [Saprospiraceae bacterium]|nr:T9SS type A sorting domain-containing protein [Saprospiraceae bacterium]